LHSERNSLLSSPGISPQLGCSPHLFNHLYESDFLLVSYSRLDCLRLLKVLSIDPAGNAYISRRVFVQDDVDDFRIGPDRVVCDLDDVPDQLFALSLRQAVLDMAFDERHGIPPEFSI
jgi:hypothetical protein